MFFPFFGGCLNTLICIFFSIFFKHRSNECCAKEKENREEPMVDYLLYRFYYLCLVHDICLHFLHSFFSDIND